MKTKEMLAEEWYEVNKFKSDCPRDIQSFNEGFSASRKQTDKLILDLLNKLRSELSDVQKPKLNKVIDQKKRMLLKGQIGTILELQNKFK